MEPLLNMPSHGAPGARALSRAATGWCLVAVLGQWAFALFVLAFHAPPTLRGDFPALNDKTHITGWVPGDDLGNVQLLAHVFMGALVTASGALQLLPAFRRRWPAVHRWNGRFFLLTAVIATLSGFYLTWVRGSQVNAVSAWSISVNGALILIFALLALRAARARDFARHRRHALRLWLLVNGVWFLRIAFMLAGVTLGPLGIEMGYDSTVFLALSVLGWLLPLCVLQAYFAAENARTAAPRYAVAAVLGLSTLATAVGTSAAIAFMWWPRLQ